MSSLPVQILKTTCPLDCWDARESERHQGPVSKSRSGGDWEVAARRLIDGSAVLHDHLEIHDLLSVEPVVHGRKDAGC